jgi:hypothetical protein
MPAPLASVVFSSIVESTTSSVPSAALWMPAPSVGAKLRATVESTTRIVPTPSNWPSLTIALATGSYTPGAGMSSTGSGSNGSMNWAGSGIISPGLSTTSLSTIETLPFETLLTAAPPPPAELPASLESTISTRPLGIVAVEGSEPLGHWYANGSSLFRPPPSFCARLSSRWTFSSFKRPGDQFWIPPPPSSE